MYSYHGLLIRSCRDGRVRWDVGIEHGGGRVGHGLLDMAFEICRIVCRLAERPQCLELCALADLHLLSSICLPLQNLCLVSAISTLMYAQQRQINEDKFEVHGSFGLTMCSASVQSCVMMMSTQAKVVIFFWHAWSFDELHEGSLQIFACCLQKHLCMLSAETSEPCRHRGRRKSDIHPCGNQDWAC